MRQPVDMPAQQKRRGKPPEVLRRLEMMNAQADRESGIEMLSIHSVLYEIFSRTRSEHVTSDSTPTCRNTRLHVNSPSNEIRALTATVVTTTTYSTTHVLCTPPFARSSLPAFVHRTPLIRGDLDDRLLSAAALSGDDWQWSTLPVPETSPKPPSCRQIAIAIRGRRRWQPA
jgi:hypothetical protein